MDVLPIDQRRIYKQVVINGDHSTKFKAYLPYMKPFNEQLIIRSANKFTDPTILNDEFDEALITSIQELFPGAIMQSMMVLFDVNLPRILNLPNVHNFEIIVRSDLVGIELYEGMPLDDFFVPLKMRFEWLPPEENFKYFVNCHNVILPFENVKNHRNKIIPI